MFPAEALPPAALKAWRAVLPRDTLVFRGRRHAARQMAPYWAAGANGFGTGSNLYKPGATRRSTCAPPRRPTPRRSARCRRADAAGAMTCTAIDIVALGEPMIEFNQTRARRPARVRAGLRRRHVEHGDRRGAARRARRPTSTRVGDDAFGRLFLACGATKASTLAAWRSIRPRPPASTSSRTGPRATSSRTCAPARRRAGCAPATLPLDVIRGGARRCTCRASARRSRPACDAVFAAIDAAREAGARVSYDPNLRLEAVAAARARARSCSRRSAQCDWCLPSRDDARVLFGTGEPDAVDRCAATRAGAPVRRAEARRATAASCRDGRTRGAHRRHRVATVDATGAGDCFDGAFAARLARATIRSPPRAMPMPRRRSRRPASAPWRRCRVRATSTCCCGALHERDVDGATFRDDLLRGPGRAGRRRHQRHRRRHRRRVRGAAAPS